mgnify:CR=1 FL=1
MHAAAPRLRPLVADDLTSNQTIDGSTQPASDVRKHAAPAASAGACKIGNGAVVIAIVLEAGTCASHQRQHHFAQRLPASNAQMRARRGRSDNTPSAASTNTLGPVADGSPPILQRPDRQPPLAVSSRPSTSSSPAAPPCSWVRASRWHPRRRRRQHHPHQRHPHRRLPQAARLRGQPAAAPAPPPAPSRPPRAAPPAWVAVATFLLFITLRTIYQTQQWIAVLLFDCASTLIFAVCRGVRVCQLAVCVAECWLFDRLSLVSWLSYPRTVY